MKSKQAQKLIETLAAAGPEELAAIDEQIEALEAELAALVTDKRKAIDALKRLRAVLDVQVNGKPTKAKRQKRAAAASGTGGQGKPSPVRDKIFDFLSKQDHPIKVKAIAESTELAYASVYNALKHEWFKETADGYEIARAA